MNEVEALIGRIEKALAGDPEISRIRTSVRPWDGRSRLKVWLQHPVTGERRSRDAGLVSDLLADERLHVDRIRRIVRNVLEGLGW